MTEEEIKQIPELIKTMKIKDIALKFDVHERTINAWIKRLKIEGYKIHPRIGRPPTIDFTSSPKAKQNA